MAACTWLCIKKGEGREWVCTWSLWVIDVGIEMFHRHLHLVVGLKRKRGGGMWYSWRRYGWYTGAGGR